ncbi:kelch repeat and BTB domain-containing protein 3 isoform X4 [Moschus berezovskii]|uniref:kelch repeat and BTB domain-containing protein 3 isoform X4 n=2 Tax=Moschus berezovskii TaxID=68408 RepID=UPI0024453350|nr:kelch repeat and BTB domain-containing protein 3 isoform X4 [Moschus berezovskii]
MARTRAESLPAAPRRAGGGAPRASSRAWAGRRVRGRGAACVGGAPRAWAGRGSLACVRGMWLTRGPYCASPAPPPPPRERKPGPISALCVLCALRQRVTARGAGPQGREGRDGGAARTGRSSDLKKRQRDSGRSQSQPGLVSGEAGLETSETAVQFFKSVIPEDMYLCFSINILTSGLLPEGKEWEQREF